MAAFPECAAPAANWNHLVADKSLLATFAFSTQQLLQRLREKGYTGGYSILKEYVRTVRPTSPPAFLALQFAPGQCAQVDWGSAGFLPVGHTRRRLSFCRITTLSTAPGWSLRGAPKRHIPKLRPYRAGKLKARTSPALGGTMKTHSHNARMSTSRCWSVVYISLSPRQDLAPFPLTGQHPHRYLTISSPLPHRSTSANFAEVLR
jgi:hypothetical protein